MFFKKSREAKKAAAQEARQNFIAEVQAQFEAAKECADPGEKMLRLQDICNEVDTTLAALSGKAAKDGKNQQRAFFWTATPSALAACAVYPPALIGLAAMAGSIYGGKKLSKKFGAHAQKKQLEKERPFIDALEGQKLQAQAAQDVVVNENPHEIAASKHFGAFLTSVPRLREQFAAAYGKKAEEARKPTPPTRGIDGPDMKF